MAIPQCVAKRPNSAAAAALRKLLPWQTVYGCRGWFCGRDTSKGHSLDSFHYTLPGNPLNELNGSLLPLATPANSQLWPTNSGQLARVGIVINQFMPLSCKKTFQLWPKISDTSTLGQSAKCTIAGIEVGRSMDCIGRQHIGSRCAVTIL
jgi:hypothetical protein